MYLSKIDVNVYTYIESDKYSGGSVDEISNITEDVSNAIFKSSGLLEDNYFGIIIGFDSNFKSAKQINVVVGKLFKLLMDSKYVQSYIDKKIIFVKNDGDVKNNSWYHPKNKKIDYKDYVSKPVDSLKKVVNMLCPNTLGSVLRRFKYPDDSDRFEKVNRVAELDGNTTPGKNLPNNTEIYIKGVGMGGRVYLGKPDAPVAKYKTQCELIIDTIKQKSFKGRAYEVIENKVVVDLKYVLNFTVIINEKEFMIILECPYDDSQKLKQFFGHA